jgi:hypothetical protein
MARAILLTFGNNDAAESFVRKVALAQEGLSDTGSLTEIGAVVASASAIEWCIARPLNFCKCASGGKNHKFPWQRTTRFGWFVHESCKRVSYYVARDFVKNLKGGYRDLTGEILAPKIAEVHIMPNADHIMNYNNRDDHAKHVLGVNNANSDTSDTSSTAGAVDIGAGVLQPPVEGDLVRAGDGQAASD